jgi:hypothetical protein
MSPASQAGVENTAVRSGTSGRKALAAAGTHQHQEISTDKDKPVVKAMQELARKLPRYGYQDHTCCKTKDSRWDGTKSIGCGGGTG